MSTAWRNYIESRRIERSGGIIRISSNSFNPIKPNVNNNRKVCRAICKSNRQCRYNPIQNEIYCKRHLKIYDLTKVDNEDTRGCSV